jgi:hypothetical protein
MWSPDDAFIMMVSTKEQRVHIRCLESEVVDMETEEWTATLEDHMMVGAMWTPDSRQVITFMDMQLRATVWSLQAVDKIAYL